MRLRKRPIEVREATRYTAGIGTSYHDGDQRSYAAG